MKATADKKALPKSLHTVRILVNVALHLRQAQANGRREGRGTWDAMTPLQAVLYAATICGYPVVSADDALIAQAVAQVGR